MQLAILTLPLGHNYGGLLQAFSLQRYLQICGHDVEIVDRRSRNESLQAWQRCGKSVLKRATGRSRSVVTPQRESMMHQHLARFKEEHLSISEPLRSDLAIRRYFAEREFDGVIVGSDQVWRPRYSPSIGNYFLDFLAESDRDLRRLSYAASFGVDHWEYGGGLTVRCRELIAQFDALSVRERSGSELCERELGRVPAVVPDPTVLLDPSEFDSLIGATEPAAGKGGVVDYVLDRDPQIERAADRVSQVRDQVRDRLSIKPKMKLEEVSRSSANECEFLPVEHWLASIKGADFVVTDSFHGVLMCTIFNTPFVALGNQSRGVTRFQSFLSDMKLTSRLVTDISGVDACVREPIDWVSVNGLLRQQRELGRSFLASNLQADDR